MWEEEQEQQKRRFRESWKGHKSGWGWCSGRVTWDAEATWMQHRLLALGGGQTQCGSASDQSDRPHRLQGTNQRLGNAGIRLRWR